MKEFLAVIVWAPRNEREVIGKFEQCNTLQEAEEFIKVNKDYEWVIYKLQK